MRKGLPMEVLRALPKEYDKEDFIRDLAGASKITDIIGRVLKNKITKLNESKETDYDSPSWAHKQAHLNGKAEAYQDVINLFLRPEEKE